MIFDWYKIFNLAEFLSLGLPSRSFSYNLEDVGQKEILVCRGNGVGIVYDGIFLRLNLNNQNPFIFENHAIYVDENEDVWLGVLA